MNEERRSRLYFDLAVLAVGLLIVLLVTWWVPALNLASQNLLFRLRGSIAPSTPIVVLAVDDRSLQEVGPWPWPRSVMAEVIDRVTAATPRVIGLDIIYAEASETVHGRLDDLRLTQSVARSRQVVMPAQLYQSLPVEESHAIEWLRPAPIFGQNAASIGHVHILPGVDGMVRSVQLSKASDRGDRLWAFAVEVVRLAEGIPATEITEHPDSLILGAYRIPISDNLSTRPITGVSVWRPNEMLINFSGGTGTFQTLSIADLLANSIDSEQLRNKVVLIGATAQSMGDSKIVPFTHYGDDQLQGGREMPGVEIHANIINTILTKRYFRQLSDSSVLVFSLFSMLLTLISIRRLDGWGLVLALVLILTAIVFGSYLTFTKLLVLPPLIPMVIGLAVVLPVIISRFLADSRELDRRLIALAGSESSLPDDTVRADRGRSGRGLLPRGLDWKLRTVESLTIRLLARMGLIDRVLSSMGDGVIVTDLAGRILLSNHTAESLFNHLTHRSPGLPGSQLIELLRSAGRFNSDSSDSVISRVPAHETLQLDYTLETTPRRHLSLLFSALVASKEEAGAVTDGKVLGQVVLVSDITRRVELDRLKSETLQLVSHELRTPLNSINALSDVLLKFPVSHAETKEILSIICSESRRLGDTINLYLDLSRLESGAFPLNLVPTDVGQFIVDLCHRLSTLAAVKEIRLIADVAPDNRQTFVDQGLLNQAVTNLISNAIKYSPPQSTVLVRTWFKVEPPAGINISVTDQGCGIPPEVGAQVFEKFYRLDRDSSGDTTGSGLGLAVVREIAQRHGGSIQYTNLPECGTEFTLFLPH